ncbi:MAG: YggS family pyridoxal phosphate-dependent enzyme, partial [Ilumatobacteraceae bacterium]
MTTTSTSPPSSSEIGRRLALIRERIAAAGGADVEILAVTKTFGLPEVLAARDAGLRAVGENYAQEVVAKFGPAGPAAGKLDIAVHFIGQLQTNKVRQLVGLVDVVESVDRPSLVDELAKRMPGLRVLVQVDTSGDPGKGGCPVADVDALVERAGTKGLDVAGLMTVGPTEGGPEAARPGFRTVRAMVDRLGLAVCSMGMSDDLEVAVAEGATEVRIGSALF